jgi:hypothetical protein
MLTQKGFEVTPTSHSGGLGRMKETQMIFGDLPAVIGSSSAVGGASMNL